jgi:hypothetical protein
VPFTSPSARSVWLLVVTAVALVGVAPERGTAGATTTSASAASSDTPVRATPMLREDQLVAWWEARQPTHVCNDSSWIDGVWTCHGTVPYEFRAGGGGYTPRGVIRLFLEEGAKEGITGDVALMQAIIETAWFFYPDDGQVRPEDNNTAGMGAFDGGAHRPYRFPDLRTGIRAQMQSLRLYADPHTATDGSNLGSPLAADVDGRYPPRWRSLRTMTTPDGQLRYSGRVQVWEGFGNGMWASDTQYASKILTPYRQALTRNGYPSDAATIGARSGVLYRAVAPTRVLDTRNSTQGELSARVGQRQTVSQRVAGVGGVPADAVAVAINVTAVAPTQDGYLTVWPSGRPQPAVSAINFRGGQVVGNLLLVEVGSGGRVQLYNHAGEVDVVFDVVGYLPPGAAYAPVPPRRILDTRDATRGGVSAPLGRRRTVSQRVAGVGGVPADARAVAVNVTAVEPTAPGFLTLWPSGRTRPQASTVNFPAGAVVGNFVLAEVGTDGRVELYNHDGDTHAVFDVVGYLPAGSPYAPMTPARVLDTRNSTQGEVSAPVGRRQSVSQRVAGVGGVPVDAAAVVINVTAVAPTRDTYVTVWPAGRVRPVVSSLNLAAGQVVGNLVVAEVGANGRVELYNHNGEVDVVFDVVGYVPAPSG